MNADKNIGQDRQGPADRQRRRAGPSPSVKRWSGLKLNKIGRVAELVDTPATRGMIAKVAHLVEWWRSSR